MLKDFAWKTFEHTGNIDSYFLFKEIEENSDNSTDSNVIKEAGVAGK